MENMHRIEAALRKAGIPASGVSPLHDTVPPSLFVFADDLIYRISLSGPADATTVKAAEDVVREITGAEVIESALSRTPEAAQVALKAHLDREAAIAAADIAKEGPPIDTRPKPKPEKA